VNGVPALARKLRYASYSGVLLIVAVLQRSAAGVAGGVFSDANESRPAAVCAGRAL